MRTMPLERRSSVEVISTARAQRRQRRTSTEATGRAAGSMLRLAEPEEEISESEAEYEETDEELP